jgi:hypothetical protein
VLLIHKKRLDNLNAIHREIIRRMSLTEDERRKAYKNGYDQGRFDEAADRELEMDMLSNNRAITSSPYLTSRKVKGKNKQIKFQFQWII